MAFTFDATVGGPAANSYITVNYADDYFDGSVYKDGWPSTSFGADLETKQQALVSATRMLERLNWDGLKTTTAQALQWPRVNLTDRDGNGLASDAIPQEIADATCELALSILALDPTSVVDDSLKQFKRLKIGSVLDMEMRDGLPRVGELPQQVLDLVSYLLLYGGGTTRVYRA